MQSHSIHRPCLSGVISSWGAIAIDFAIEHPEIVDSLILAAPGLSSDAKAQENLRGLNALTGLVKTKPPPENRLVSIRARVLIIRGDNDNPTYAAMTDKIGKGIPNATSVVIPGGTHFLNLEKPTEFDKAMQLFLKH